MKKIDFEVKLGGIFGAIAIAAIIVEVLIQGATLEVIAGGVKDVAGTLVAVLVFIIAIRQFIVKKPKNIKDILEKSVEDWGMDNAPMIFKIKNFKSPQDTDYKQGFSLLQDPNEYIKLVKNLSPESPEWDSYAAYSSKKTGRFISMPSYEKMLNESFEIEFALDQKHFKTKDNIDEIINDIVDALNFRCKNGTYSAVRNGKSRSIKIHFNNTISMVSDVEDFVDVMDFVLSMVKVIA